MPNTTGFRKFQMGAKSVKKHTSSINERHTKDEIEDKWQRLLDRSDKSSKERSSVIPTGARVIRRRKGRKDLPIA